MVRVFSNVPYRLTCVRKLTKNAPQPDRYVLESLGGKSRNPRRSGFALILQLSVVQMICRDF